MVDGLSHGGWSMSYCKVSRLSVTLPLVPFVRNVLLAGAGEVINVRPGVCQNKMCVLRGQGDGDREVHARFVVPNFGG